MTTSRLHVLWALIYVPVRLCAASNDATVIRATAHPSNTFAICAACVYSSEAARISALELLEHANPYCDAKRMILAGDTRVLAILHYGPQYPGVLDDELDLIQHAPILVARARTESYEEERLLRIANLYVAEYNKTLLMHLRKQRAMSMASQLASYGSITNNFFLVAADLVKAGVSPLSLYIQLKPRHLSHVAYAGWYIPLRNGHASYTWNDFRSAFTHVSNVLHTSALLTLWLDTSSTHTVTTIISGTNNYCHYIGMGAILNEWQQLCLQHGTLYEFDLFQPSNTAEKIFVSEDGILHIFLNTLFAQQMLLLARGDSCKMFTNANASSAVILCTEPRGSNKPIADD